MQLHLKREEQQRGLFRKTTYHVLWARIEVTPEEAEVIRVNNKGDRILITYFFDVINEDRDEKVKNFLNKNGANFGSANLDDIIRWEREIKERAAGLKELVDQHLQGRGESEEVIDL